MSKCLNCGKELIHIEGKKPKVYCNNNCRQAHWQKKKPKILKTKVLSMAEWEEIQKKLNSMEIKETKIQDATKPTNIIKPLEQPKTNYTAEIKPKLSMPDGLSRIDKLRWMRENS